MYGNEQVSVDPVTNENRALVGEDMALKDFLGAYHQKPWYAISEVPKRMAEVVQVPTIIAASPYQRLMQDVVLWFSSKDTNSHLHYDNIQNLMCVISGSKRFIMIDKKHAHHVTIDVPKGDYSAVDTDEVDLQKYPGLRDVPWWQADIDPGSCLYVELSGVNASLWFWFWFCSVFLFLFFFFPAKNKNGEKVRRQTTTISTDATTCVRFITWVRPPLAVPSDVEGTSRSTGFIRSDRQRGR